MNQPAIIRCRGVTVGYDREPVLEGVDLEIRPGTFLPFVGPNGAGKTTLLRAILGLIPVRAGTIETPFANRPAGFVPQHQSIDLLFPVTVHDIVLMGCFPKLGWWGQPGNDDREKVARLFERFGLAGHAGRPFRELSGGMRQKILIMRALANGAEVLVMDEPTNSLDAGSEQEVIRLLHELAVTDGKTILFAQHGLDLVRHLTPEICWFRRGKVSVVPWRDLDAPLEEAIHD